MSDGEEIMPLPEKKLRNRDILAAELAKFSGGQKVDLNFKSIHQQVQEEEEKGKNIVAKNKISSLPDFEIDEKLLNLLMPSETFNEDDFDYFEYFGSRRFEPSKVQHDRMKEDIKRFKSLRSKVEKTDDSKEAAIYIAKESQKVQTKKINLIKLKPKVADDTGKKDLKEDKSVNKAPAKKESVVTKPKPKTNLVEYSSDDEDEDNGKENRKKLKT